MFKFESMQSFKACWDCCAVLGNNDLREALAELTRTELRQGLLPGGVSSSRFDALILCFGGVLQAAASLPIELSTRIVFLNSVFCECKDYIHGLKTVRCLPLLRIQLLC